MRELCVGVSAIVVAVTVFGALLVSATPVSSDQHLLGAKKCSWGPTYWCSNLTNAKGCNAVRHCIQTVWEKRPVPVDNDSVCQICKDMVQQARDQLRSNETMEEMKEVFEGSCKLIPISAIKKECCKLVDDFIPELVEALSSQMNPDQVCSIAGLCNNAGIDRLLMHYYGAALEGTLTEDENIAEASVPKATSQNDISKEVSVAPKKLLLTCGNCFNLATLMTDKFSKANRDDILENILHLCGEMSSFSDACANIVLTYFNDVYENIKANLSPTGICHMSGVCSNKYHQHADDPKEEKPIDLTAASNDDIPCELCQQLVHHLRDLLIANTTEAEFKQVLEGLCKQIKGFKDECLSIVDQYYDVIYKTLVDDLDANGACFLIGICPRDMSEKMPLLSTLPPAEIKVTIRKKLGANEPKFSQEDLKAMALPIDKLMGAANPSLLVENGELCTLCEYLLHFIQETLATPATEEEIKRTVGGVCKLFPNSIRDDCHKFIDTYGDAVIALLIQGLDPSTVCPKMQMCPSNNKNHKDVEVFAPSEIGEGDQPTCPLCLFAVEQAQERVKNDKSKSNIKNVLDHLCEYLPQELRAECVDFVDTYSSELIDMLITDFKPQEICVSLKLCPKTNNYLEEMGLSGEDESNSSEEDIASNKVYGGEDGPVEIVFERYESSMSPSCVLCEELVKMAEKRLINKHTTKADIVTYLEHSCDKMSKSISAKCHKYVEKYGDAIASLVLKEMEPKTICMELGLCLFSEQEDLEIDEAFKYDVFAMPNHEEGMLKTGRLTGQDEVAAKAGIMQEPPSCVLCEFVMTKLEMELRNTTEQEKIKHAVENICRYMPKTVAKSCNSFIEEYADEIIRLISSVPPKQICQQLHLCFAALDEVVSDEVIECGVCHGASMALLPFFKQHLDHDSIEVEDMVAVGCENLPAKYYQICSEMVRIYGRSLMNISERAVVEEAHICAEIGKCFNDEKSGLAFARISA